MVAERGREKADLWLPVSGDAAGRGKARGRTPHTGGLPSGSLTSAGRDPVHRALGWEGCLQEFRVTGKPNDNTNLVDGARWWPLLSRLGCGGRGRRGLLGPGLLLKRRDTQSARSQAARGRSKAALKLRSSALAGWSQVLQVLETPARNTPRQRVSLKGWKQRHSFPHSLLARKTWLSGIRDPCPAMHVVRVLPLDCRSRPRGLWSDAVPRGLTQGRRRDRLDAARDDTAAGTARDPQKQNRETIATTNLSSQVFQLLHLSDQIAGITLPSHKKTKVLHKKETKLPGKTPRRVGLQQRKTYKRLAKNLKERELKVPGS